jgi:hypothetical protein
MSAKASPPPPLNNSTKLINKGRILSSINMQVAIRFQISLQKAMNAGYKAPHFSFSRKSVRIQILLMDNSHQTHNGVYFHCTRRAKPKANEERKNQQAKNPDGMHHLQVSTAPVCRENRQPYDRQNSTRQM